MSGLTKNEYQARILQNNLENYSGASQISEVGFWFYENLDCRVEHLAVFNDMNPAAKC